MIPAIVLAAGASERMGRPKALLTIGDRPAVEVVVQSLRDGGAGPVFVVVGRHAAEIRTGARLEHAWVVEHKGWAAGRTSSLQAGLRLVPDEAPGALVALVDMPFIRAATVAALIDAFTAKKGAQAAVPTFDGRRGHPVLIGRALFAKVLALGPDGPPRGVVRKARPIEVPVDDPGVLVDLDTPEDVARAAKSGD